MSTCDEFSRALALLDLRVRFPVGRVRSVPNPNIWTTAPLQ
jgi:hypothetical protein